MVSSGSLDDSPPLTLSALSTSGSFSLSSSGSLQTRLSSFNSEQRLRSLPSVTDDLEKQANPNTDDEVDGDDDNRQIVVENRFWWLVRAFVWFSALFFPISALGDYGFLLRHPSVDPFSGDNEPGLHLVRGIEFQLMGWLGYSPSLWENERLLSKITTLDLQPSRFRYSIFDGFYNSHDLTACVWSNLADSNSSLEWVQEWPGGLGAKRSQLI